MIAWAFKVHDFFGLNYFKDINMNQNDAELFSAGKNVFVPKRTAKDKDYFYDREDQSVQV